MQKKLTISIDEEVYTKLYLMVGRRKISHFVEDLIRPYVIKSELEAGYRQMAKDKTREKEALEWAEATFGDSVHEPW
ncbi:MAG: addiction module antitoxin [Candidatus Schekmanbacteria bacterium]|nr:addiction module antitoxin [Candidatus Schekmanbacteria bacterium]